MVDQLEAERLSEARLQSYFDTNSRTSDATVHSLLPGLKSRLFELYDLETLTAKLKTGRSGTSGISPQDKQTTWNQLKGLSFTRTITALYTLCLIDALLRTQLSILARYLFLASANMQQQAMQRRASMSWFSFSRADVPSQSISAAGGTLMLSDWTQHRFLSQSEYVQTHGLSKVAARVEIAVAEVMAEYSLKSSISLNQLTEIIRRVRSLVESDPSFSFVSVSSSIPTLSDSSAAGVSNVEQQQQQQQPPPPISPQVPSSSTHPLAQYLVAPESTDSLGGGAVQLNRPVDEGDRQLQSLMDETRDLIESADFASVLASCIDAAFQTCIDQHIRPSFLSSLVPASSSDAAEGSSSPTPFPEPSSSSSSYSRSSKSIDSLPLPRIIAIMNNTVHSVLSPRSNDCLRAIGRLDIVRGFVEMIYQADSVNPSASIGSSPLLL
eukprot:CAMPEP_0184652486 /NCGR_PEP_ID=MMETSP0308-20130426/10180_1 /TAXON_ID=38269 /ORGANISM="Gloeochaete witrockiana, Strain SAG 46.84" /LENGTH=438 /DNA_ID=CAMNT_0027087385 /DNA_START=185 /DNA_END=1501 /DNA_ORIENTATION=+